MFEEVFYLYLAPSTSAFAVTKLSRRVRPLAQVQRPGDLSGAPATGGAREPYAADRPRPQPSRAHRRYRAVPGLTSAREPLLAARHRLADQHRSPCGASAAGEPAPTEAILARQEFVHGPMQGIRIRPHQGKSLTLSLIRAPMHWGSHRPGSISSQSVRRTHLPIGSGSADGSASGTGRCRLTSSDRPGLV